MSIVETRLYHRPDVVSFRRTGEAFGGLSNMAPGFPVTVNGRSIRTVEALYQACRFPHLPEVQRMILGEASPMTAKMRGKPFRNQSRPDWDDVRIAIMKWTLRVKLVHNWTCFSDLLLETGERPIVEDSRNDDFWGAMSQNGNQLAGRNVLGRLLMELRDRLRTEPETLTAVDPVPIPNFLMLDEEIETINRFRFAPVTVSVSQPALL